MFFDAVYWVCAVVLVAAYAVLRDPYRPLPLVGHAHIVIGRTQQDVLRWMLRAAMHFHGEPWRLEVPLVGKGWFVNDARNLKYVLHSQATFSKGRFFTERTRDLFGHGILLATGDSWKMQRNAGSILVNARNLDIFTQSVLLGHLNVLLDPLTRAAATQTFVDLCDIATDFSLAVFGHVALESDWQTTRDHFSRPFLEVSGRIADRFRLPCYWIFERILPYGRRLRRDLDRVHSHIRDMVRDAHSVDHMDVSDGRGVLLRELLDTPMTQDQVADSCLNFVTAGVDTTAQALSWTMYLLIRHPEYIATLRQESGNSLMKAVISESLRLQPPIPLEISENISGKTIILPSGHLVAPGEQVMWSSWVMARLPGSWGDYPSRFYPERWLEMRHRPSAYEWPVFHAGPRACLGQSLAKIELEFALRELLQRYNFEMAWTGEKGVGKGLTAPIDGGLPVRVTLRQGHA